MSLPRSQRDARDVQAPSCLVNLSLAHHQNSNAGAVQYRDSAEIEDDFLGMLTENFRQFQFHFARAVAQDYVFFLEHAIHINRESVRNSGHIKHFRYWSSETAVAILRPGHFIFSDELSPLQAHA